MAYPALTMGGSIVAWAPGLGSGSRFFRSLLRLPAKCHRWAADIFAMTFPSSIRGALRARPLLDTSRFFSHVQMHAARDARNQAIELQDFRFFRVSLMPHSCAFFQ